ncbi:outer membrane protein [Desulfosediminicola sp.]|uniref:outer membrane protein n=1 Tax=Desulfosediminicola sp. TaxID=2886825 RepID=UPI003AF23046
MKRTMITAAAGTLLLISSSMVSAQSGPYTSIHFGMAIPDDTDTSWSGVPLATVSADSGYAMTGALGYDFGGFRLESELGYQGNSIDTARVGGLSLPASGDMTIYSGLLNLYVDFRNESNITPYITAGMGLAHVAMDSFDVAGIVSSTSKYTDTVMIGQVGGGLEMAVNENLALDVRYRYMMTEEAHLGYLNSELSSHNVYAGLRFKF